MKIHLKSIIIVILSLPLLMANLDLYAPWLEVTVHANIDNEPMTVHAKLENNKIIELSLNIDGNIINVPKTEFTDINNPQLHTLEITYGRPRHTEEGDKPIIFVTLKYGDIINYDELYEFSTVSYHFTYTKYDVRWIRSLSGYKEWEHTIKKPGELEKPGGTTKVMK